MLYESGTSPPVPGVSQPVMVAGVFRFGLQSFIQTIIVLLVLRKAPLLPVARSLSYDSFAALPSCDGLVSLACCTAPVLHEAPPLSMTAYVCQVQHVTNGVELHASWRSRRVSS